ncbi:hypothetical protein BGX26_000932 [Mortierella sp. AD094]|nr:hypothetical protein BGX26_000932 [Mortierella sp. AD094]
MPASKSEDPLQVFRAVYRDEATGTITPLSEIVNIKPRFNSKTNEYIILWNDVKMAFTNPLHVRHGNTAVPFLTDDDFEFNYNLPDTKPTINFEPPPVTSSGKCEIPQTRRAPQGYGESLGTSTSEPTGRAPQYIPDESRDGVVDSEDDGDDFYDYIQPVVDQYSNTLSSEIYVDGQEHEGRDMNTNYDLGVAYCIGKSAPQDYRKAVECFLKAANQGHVAAHHKLGSMYNSGQGVEQDYLEAVDWYQKAADQGYAKAQYSLGFMYEHGYGVAQDYAKSLEWYQKAANQGYDLAQCSLGIMYGNGYGVKQDYYKAVEWYRKASHQGLARAQYNLGFMFEGGYGVTRDHIKAAEWYRKAGVQGNDPAQFALGLMYSNGYGVTQDHSQAVEWYRKSAVQGNVRAQYNLGVMYDNGYGMARDRSMAVEWYQEAANKGYHVAECGLGLMYSNGYGVTQDFAEAIEWFRKSAKKGNPKAQYNMGVMYEKGHGVTQDLSKAAEWYEKAANQGYADAQCGLGIMYGNGYGVNQDYSKAVELYQEAANRGHPGAQNNLGLMYDNGYGVSRDHFKAMRWYRKAADRGYSKAQFNLGLVYYNGEGVKKNVSQAIEWWKKAATQGHADAQHHLATLKIGGSPSLSSVEYPQVFRPIYRDNVIGTITPLPKTVNIEPRLDSKSGEYTILWNDLKTATKDPLNVWRGETSAPFLTDEDFEFSQLNAVFPLRISAYPGVVLNVAIKMPEVDTGLAPLRIQDSRAGTWTLLTTPPPYSESDESDLCPPEQTIDESLGRHSRGAPQDYSVLLPNLTYIRPTTRTLASEFVPQQLGIVPHGVGAAENTGPCNTREHDGEEVMKQTTDEELHTRRARTFLRITLRPWCG